MTHERIRSSSCGTRRLVAWIQLIANHAFRHASGDHVTLPPSGAGKYPARDYYPGDTSSSADYRSATLFRRQRHVGVEDAGESRPAKAFIFRAIILNLEV